MKAKEKRQARLLRLKGWSLRTIAQKVLCSKSTISKWIADIALTKKQIEKLRNNQDKGRARAANHPNSNRAKWQRIRSNVTEEARRDIPRRGSALLLKSIGAALYWAEGYNASRNSIIFANTDPNMIKLMMLFFRNACKIPESKFRGKVCIHPHLNIQAAEKYWSEISKIPLRQFNKPLLAVSRSSGHKRDTLPMGTFSILIGDVYTCSRIKGWIEGLSSMLYKGG